MAKNAQQYVLFKYGGIGYTIYGVPLLVYVVNNKDISVAVPFTFQVYFLS